MKQSTYDLVGHALDWAVVKALTWSQAFIKLNYQNGFHPSTNWAQGGVIIERECISIEHKTGTDWWVATRIEGSAVSEEYGRTPLVAAMRCYVASKLGDTVDIPDELLTKETI